MHRRARVIAAMLASSAAIATLAIWSHVLGVRPRTGPNAMTWRAPGGDAVERPDGCTAIDPNLDLAVWRGGVIVPCDDAVLGRGWAFLDPGERDARVRWPLTPDLVREVTHGLVPDGDRLGVVFGELEGRLFAGVMGPRGWAHAPVHLGRTGYRAAAWVRGALEVVTATGDGAFEIVRISDELEHRPGPTSCNAPAIVYRAHAWIFEGSDCAVDETGAAMPRIVDALDDSEVDLVAHGRLAVPPRLLQGERVQAIDAHGAAGWSTGGDAPIAAARFAIDGRSITRRPLALTDEITGALAESVGRFALEWHTDERDTLIVSDGVMERAIARWYQGSTRRTVIPHGDGFWMVDASGEHVHFDRALRRTDPLPLAEHLRQRGSLGRHVDNPTPALRLGLALFVAPVLAIALLLLAAVGRARRQRTVTAPLVIATSAIALGVIVVCYARSLPLL